MAKPLILTFGKHKGLNLDQVMIVDPDYFDWLQAQSAFLAKKPDLARAFTELGVTGDNTPLHNALQAMFLDDAVCEALLRQLIREDADETLRRQVIAKRRTRLVGPVERGPSAWSEEPRLRTTWLKTRRRMGESRRQLVAAMSGSDAGLKGARDTARNRRIGYTGEGLDALSLTEANDLRSAAVTQLDSLDAAILAIKRKLAELRGRLMEARAEADRLTPGDVLVRYLRDERRMEERNGSDVRLKCRLAARARKTFDAPDQFEWAFDLFIELKPYVSDDYPNLLRQMETQKRLAKDIGYASAASSGTTCLRRPANG